MIDEQMLNNLIARICDQDIRAQADLFELTYKYFYQIAISILRNKEDAEDVVSIFFENIYTISDKCNKSKHKIGYLRASVINIAKNIIRTNKRYCYKNIDCPIDNDVNRKIDFKSDFMNLLDNNLTEQERQVIIHMIYYDYTYREMAKITGSSVGKVQRIKYSAINKIKKSNII